MASPLLMLCRGSGFGPHPAESRWDGPEHFEWLSMWPIAVHCSAGWEGDQMSRG